MRHRLTRHPEKRRRRRLAMEPLELRALLALVGWWNLDEGMGEVAADSSPSPAGGAPHPGLLVNYGQPVSDWNQDLTGASDGITMPHGLRFNGGLNDSQSNYVSLDDATADFTALTRGAISAWFRRDIGASPNDHSIIGFGRPGNNNYIRIQIEDGNSYLVNESFADGAGTSSSMTAPYADDGNWHHVAFTSDGTQSALFVDGQRVASGSQGFTRVDVTQMALGMTPRNNQLLWYFNGTIADVRIYDEVLSGDPGSNGAAAEAGSELEYISDPLHFGDGQTDAFRVVATDPASGAILGTAPTSISVDFSFDVDGDSLAAEDLTLDGMPAVDFELLDADSVRFDLPPGIASGVHIVRVEAGAIESDMGRMIESYLGEFTIPAPPNVETLAAIDIGPNVATLRGRVVDDGQGEPSVSVYWGESDGGENAQAWDNVIHVGQLSPGEFSEEINGLQLNTTYFHRVFISNLAGDNWAAHSESFTTLPVYPPVLITEFMASNEDTLLDANGRSSDWIELYQAGDAPVDLAGWHLTDDPGNLTQWTFPTRVLRPGEYLLVFASGNQSPTLGSELHANFQLEADGQYVALVQPDAATIVSEHGAQGAAYPRQYRDVSYGFEQTVAIDTLVPAEGQGKFLTPLDNSIETTWNQIDFLDDSWQDVAGAVGFEVAATNPGLLAYWDFNIDAGPGEAVPDVSGASTTHPGSLQGNAFTAQGTLNLDGNGDYVSVGDRSELEGLGMMTIAARARPSDSSTALRRIIEHEDVFYFWSENGAFRFTNHGSAQHVISTSGPVAGQWTHFLATFDGSLGRIYINGVLEATAPLGAMTTSTYPLQIGARRSAGGSPSNYWNGQLDEAAIWDRVLSQEEITALASGTTASGIGTTVSDLIDSDVAATMHSANASSYLRRPFQIAGDPTRFDELSLNVVYDDGFVAYLNGVEVARRNVDDPIGYASAATVGKTLPMTEQIDVSEFLSLLNEGDNVLAVQAMNASSDDADFLLSTELVATDLETTAQRRYFDAPTPGQTNTPGYLDVLTDEVVFSHSSATFSQTFQLELSTTAADASIHFTLDGSVPSINSPTYTAPLTIDGTTQVRARAIQAELAPGPLNSESYVHLAADLQQFSSPLPIVVLENFGAGAIPNKRLGDGAIGDGTGIKEVARQPAFLGILDGGGTTTMTSPLELASRAGIRVRGGSSAQFEKPSLSVESWGEGDDDFDVQPFDLPAESDWILYGPSSEFDRSLIHNSYIYELSQQLGRYAVRFHFVEVFINTGGGSLALADHGGVYIFMEKVEAGNGRLEVERLSTDGSEGGWMLQVDRLPAIPEDGSEHPPTFHTAGPNGVLQGPYGGGPSGTTSSFDQGGDDIPVGYNNFFSFESPLGTEINQNQQQSIKTWLQDFETALYGPDFNDPEAGYAAFIDVGSFIDHLILNNLPKNRDGLQLSTFLYRENETDRLHLGPIWDFDRAYNTNTFGGGATDSLTWGQQFLWMPRLFEDPDFEQAYIDRWQQLRQGPLSSSNLRAIADNQAAEITDEVAARNGTAGWGQKLDDFKNWITTRANAIDGQFTAPPQLSSTGGIVPEGQIVQIAAPQGAVYYTLDGSDPRAPGGGIADGAVMLDASMQISLASGNQLLVTRAWNGGDWSGPASAVFLVGETPADASNLRVSEIMYNPAPPSSEELAAGFDNKEDFEFLELTNVSDQMVSLAGVRFAAGSPVDFDFTDGQVLQLQPGEYVLVVANADAFAARYGDAFADKIAGEFADGRLSNSGEAVSVLDFQGMEILSFQYDDQVPWPVTADGYGFSLVLREPLAQADADEGTNWRASGSLHGSPGEPDQATQVAIVINELLTHTDAPQVDTIELYNPSGENVDVGGWFLSDDRDQPTKYALPPVTIVPANGYLSLLEDDDANPLTDPGPNYFGGVLSLSSLGEEIYLFSAAGGSLTGHVDGHAFPASLLGESLGRWPNLTGALYPMTTPTLGDANSGPRVGPLIISEIMYQPPTPADPLIDPRDLEYLEIHNPTGQSVDLSLWEVQGVGYTFPAASSLAAERSLLLVPFDPLSDTARIDSFENTYGVDLSSINVAGPYSGALDNGGEKITLLRADDPPPEMPAVIPLVIEDQADYSGDSPWPSADGTGSALMREVVTLWGNDPASWFAGVPTPGSVDFGPPQVLLVRLNAGEIDPPDLPGAAQPTHWTEQRSQWSSIEVTFSRPVQVEANELVLTNLGVNAPQEPDLAIVLTDDQLSITDNILTVTFATDQLSDGVYSLQILATVTDALGQSLDGNRDGSGGDDYLIAGDEDNRFYRLTADWNGDAGVTIFDFPAFAYWFGVSVPAAPAYMDLNGDDGITIFDFPRFAEQFGKGVIFPMNLAAIPSIAPAHPGNSRQSDAPANESPETSTRIRNADVLFAWIGRERLDDRRQGTGLNSAFDRLSESQEADPLLRIVQEITTAFRTPSPYPLPQGGEGAMEVISWTILREERLGHVFQRLAE